MREPDFIIGQGDLGEPLIVTIKDSQGTPVNLSGKTVLFQLRKWSGEALMINYAATPDPDQNANTGRVTYTWQAGDTAFAGDYYGDFKVTGGSPSPITYPNDDRRKLYIHISARLV